MMTRSWIHGTFALVVLGTLAACKPTPPPDPVVPKAAVIKSFTATPGSIEDTAPVTLSWAVENATSVAITRADGSKVAGVDASAADGTVSVEVSEDTLFVLTARGEGGSDARSVTVEHTRDEPEAMLFTAIPAEIVAGEAAAVVWNLGGEGTVTITDDAGNTVYSGEDRAGSVAVRPTQNTDYTLTTGESSLKTGVGVGAKIFHFQASTTATLPGSEVTLTWSVGGADKVTLSREGEGELLAQTTAAEMADGSFTHTVPETLPQNGLVTYVLTAERGAQVLTRAQVVYVSSDPVITGFTVPAYAKKDGTFVVSWQTGNATRVDLEWEGQIVHQALTQAEVNAGSFTLATREGSTSLRLHAYNERGGHVTADGVVASVGEPTLDTFTATPDVLANGGQVSMLTWNVPNARHVKISLKNQYVLYEDTGVDAESGSIEVYPNLLSEYVLEADNSIGDGMAPATVQVDVTAPAKLVFNPASVPNGTQVQLTGTTVTGGGDLIAHSFAGKNVPGDAFIDIVGTGAALDFDADDDTVSKLITLPEPMFVNVGGQQVGGDKVSVSINGWLIFRATTLSGPGTPGNTLPTTQYEPYAILPFSEDLEFNGSAQVLWQYDTVGNGVGRLIVQWEEVPYYNALTKTASFQAQIYSTGEIVFAYKAFTNLANTDVPQIGVINHDETGAVRPSPAQLDPVTSRPQPGDTFRFFGVVPLPTPVVATTEPVVARQLVGNGFIDLATVPDIIPAGQFEITEVNYRPATGQAEWIEITSNSSAPVDLNGWYLDFGNGVQHTFTQSLVLPANGRLLLGQTADAAEASNGGPAVDYVYGSSFVLPDTNGSVSIGIAGGTYHSISWGSSGTDGVSLVVQKASADLVLNSSLSGVLTCAGSGAYGANGQQGTPKAANNNCHPWALSSIPGNFQPIALDPGAVAITGMTSTSNNGIDSVTKALDFTATTGGRAVKVGNALFGNAAKPISVCSNGWAALVSTTTTSSANPTAPATSNPNGVLAIFWDDLAGNAGTTSNPSGVYWKQFDPDAVPASGDEYTLISWENWKRWSSSVTSQLNFQIKILEATGDVEYHYGNMTSSNGTYHNGDGATAWLEALDGLTATKVLANEPILQPNSGYRFTYTP